MLPVQKSDDLRRTQIKNHCYKLMKGVTLSGMFSV